MAYTVTEAITLFRNKSGENEVQPTNATVLKYLNMARNSNESALLDLFPALSSEMGTIADPTTINLTASTSSYTLSTKPETIQKVEVKYAASDDYTEVKQVIHKHLDGNNSEALRASAYFPIVGIYNGYIDLFPEPSIAVTSGLKIYGLSLPSALVLTDSYVESNRVVDIQVCRAIKCYYRSKKLWDEMKAWADQEKEAIIRAVRYAPGQAPEQTVPKGRGNLSRYTRYSR